jgi:hypothetical protein
MLGQKQLSGRGLLYRDSLSTWISDINRRFSVITNNASNHFSEVTNFLDNPKRQAKFSK